jgi:hypothetical protein
MTVKAGTINSLKASTFSNLDFWNSTLRSPYTLNGSTVSDWGDLSANGEDSTQVSSVDQPFDDQFGMDGIRGFYFNYRYMSIGGGSYTPAKGNYSCFTSFRCINGEDSDGAYIASDFSGWGNLDTLFGLGRQNQTDPGSGKLNFETHGPSTDISNNVNSTGRYDDSISHIGSFVVNGTSYKIQADGVEFSATSSQSGCYRGSAVKLASSVAAAGSVQTRMGEIFQYSEARSADETSALNQYMRKWWKRFTPFDLGVTVDLWIDFADEALPTLNGSNIADFIDKSGNRYDMPQATSTAQPPYTHTLNHRKISTYTGNDFLDGGNILNYTGTATITFVARVTTTSAPNRFVTARGGATATYYDIYRDSSSGYLTLYDGVVSHQSTKILDNNTWYIIRVELNGGSSKFYINGDLYSTFTYAPTGTTAAPFQLGNYGSQNAYLKGNIAEVTIFPSILSTSNATALENYYANKWLSNPDYKSYGNLKLWVSAEKSPITFNGSNIAQIDDLSGYDNHLTQGTSTNQPLYVADVLNEQAVMRYASNDYLRNLNAISTSPSTIFIVCEVNSPAVISYIFDGTNSTSRNAFFARDAGSDMGFHAGSSNNFTETLGQFAVFAFVFDDTNASYYLNGVTKVTGANVGTQDLASGITLGARENLTEFLDGDIAEILVYEGELSSGTISKINQDLLESYNL